MIYLCLLIKLSCKLLFADHERDKHLGEMLQLGFREKAMRAVCEGDFASAMP